MIKKGIETGLFAFLVIIAAVFWQKIVSENKRENTNLIIVSVDALRADHMSIYGYNKNTTPNIDSWGKDAFVFNQVRTVIPITYPSFAALFTGLLPASSKIDRNVTFQPISQNTQTLASILKNNGFNNAAFLSNDVLNKEINKGINNLSKDFDAYESFPYKNGEKINNVNYEKFINNAITWFIKNKEKRKFLWLHLNNAHGPYYPPTSFQCLFNQEYCQQIKNKSEQELSDEEKNLAGCQEQIISKDKIGLHETLYDGEIGYLDTIFGQLIENLKNNHLDKNTVIVFLSDHGEGFDHNYNFSHGRVLYESSVRIPLIIKIPWINSHKKSVSVTVDNTDIMPTLVDLLRLKTDQLLIDGSSFSFKLDNKLLNLLPVKEKINKQFVFIVTSGSDKYAVTDGKYKYIYSLPDSCSVNDQIKEELYNLITDPNEVNNLVLKNPMEKNFLREELMTFLFRFNLSKDTIINQPGYLQEGNSQLDNFKYLGY